jgi:hypothetical protein
MNVEKLKEIIDEVNNGNWEEYSQYFNDDISLFIKIITRYNLLDELNPLSDSLGDYQNEILYELVNINPDKWYNFICEKLINNDLTYFNNDWHLYLTDITDLSDLFYSSSRRDYSARDAAKAILGEDSWDPYWDTTDDVYRDVVEVLNDENLKLLYDRMFTELNGKSVSAETELLVDLDTEGSEEVVVTSDNFNQMFTDEETLEYLIKQECEDVKSELYSIHNGSYNNAYESELYSSVWNELTTFFSGRPEWGNKPNPYQKDKKIYYLNLKINDIRADIDKWLSETKTSRYSTDSLEYIGSYMGMLKEGMDQGIWEYLDFRIPDYPDSSYVDKNINEMFGDYF